MYYKPKLKNELTLDNKLKVSEIINKYGKYPSGKIYHSYKSFMTFSKAKHKNIDFIDGGNKALDTMNKIIKKYKDNFIVCSHAITMINLFTAFTKKIIPSEKAVKINGNTNWCSLIGFKKTNYKYNLKYGPSANYWK